MFEYSTLPLIQPKAATLPAYKAGQRVVLDTPVTGGSHQATVVRSRYSMFFESWHYDIRITSDKSLLFPRGHVECSVVESRLRSVRSER